MEQENLQGRVHEDKPWSSGTIFFDFDVPHQCTYTSSVVGVGSGRLIGLGPWSVPSIF